MENNTAGPADTSHDPLYWRSRRQAHHPGRIHFEKYALRPQAVVFAGPGKAYTITALIWGMLLLEGFRVASARYTRQEIVAANSPRRRDIASRQARDLSLQHVLPWIWSYPPDDSAGSMLFRRYGRSVVGATSFSCSRASDFLRRGAANSRKLRIFSGSRFRPAWMRCTGIGSGRFHAIARALALP